MRIMFGKNTIREIFEINATPAWKEGKSTQDNPSIYSVGILYAGDDEYQYAGNYKLDGTKETYEKAKENFEIVCEKLLTQGWCRDTDFENFEWY